MSFHRTDLCRSRGNVDLNKKNNTQFIILLLIVSTLLFFQNCAKQLISQCGDCDTWKSTGNEIEFNEEMQKVSFYDEKLSELLLKSKELVSHKVSGVAKKNTTPFFGEEFAAIVHLPSRFEGLVFNIHSDDENSESARMKIENGTIIIQHASREGVAYTMKFPIRKPEKEIVLGVFFGVKVLDIRLVMNGRLLTNDNTNMMGQMDGDPANFSYLEKRIEVSNSVFETLIFNRKLSSYELASLSRNLNRIKKLDLVVFDPLIKQDSDVDFIRERAEFMAARTVLKNNNCFKCHGSWVSYGEYNFISNGLIKENSPTYSQLWTRLKGTFEPNKLNQPKDMPLQQSALKDEELDTLKTWITTFR